MGSLEDSSDQCFGRKQNHYQRWVNSLRRDCRKTAEKLASDRLPAASCHTSDTHRGTLQMRFSFVKRKICIQRHRTIKTPAHKWSIPLESGVCIRNEVKATPLSRVFRCPIISLLMILATIGLYGGTDRWSSFGVIPQPAGFCIISTVAYWFRRPETDRPRWGHKNGDLDVI